MPPRRSTRSSTADITPEPTKTRQANRASTKTIVPKKEPSEPDSSEEVEEEEEEPVKAKRKPANGAANKGRTSTASTSSRPSRSRSSKPTVRRVAEDDSSDEEEKENEEEEGEEEAPPRKSAPRSTRGKSAAPLSASSQTNGRTQKARGKKTVVSPSPEASDREVTPAPVTRQGEALSDSDGGTPVTTAKATKAGKKRVVDSDSDADETVEDNEVEEELLAVKVEDGDTEQSASPPAKKRTPATDASTDEEDEDDLMATKPASVRPRPSLVMPPPQPAEPEDTGPKPRLVIHKMALVNFKSYKGRQEIGPFHKVRPRSYLVQLILVKHFDPLVLFLYRRSQWFRKI
jgi:structural maintenance of chromosome 4